LTAPASSSRAAATASAASAPSTSAAIRNGPVILYRCPGESRDPFFSIPAVAEWVPAFAGTAIGASRALDKGVHDLLVAGVLEIDRQLVVLDRPDRAVAELLVEHAVADG